MKNKMKIIFLIFLTNFFLTIFSEELKESNDPFKELGIPEFNLEEKSIGKITDKFSFQQKTIENFPRFSEFENLDPLNGVQKIVKFLTEV